MRSSLAVAFLAALVCSAPSVRAQPSPSGSTDGRFDQVAERYHQLLLRQPRRGTAFDLLFRHYLDAGQLDELVARYEQLAKDRPDDFAPHLVLGLLYERRGREEEALQQYGRAAELKPDDVHVHYYRGLLLQQTHRGDEAIAAFRQALEHDPQRNELLDIHKKLGRIHARRGETEKALEVWSELAEKFPEDRFVLEELAELLAEEEQFEEAIRRYQQLAELSDIGPYRQLTARIEIGRVQVRQGRLETAIETFEACLEDVRPDSWLARDIRSRIEKVFLRSDDLSGLADYYRNRLKDHSDDLQARVRLAETLAELGNRDEALQEYREAVKLAPSNRTIREAFIQALVRNDSYAEAVEQAQTLLEQDPDDIETLKRLGRLHLEASQKPDDRQTAEQKALEVWKRIAAIRPEDPVLAVQVAEVCRDAAGIRSRFDLGETTDNRGRADGPLGRAALEYYREAVRRAPDVPQYHEYLGEFLYSVGRTEDAVAAWRKIAAPPRDTADNLKRLAEILESADRLEEAVDTLKKALAKDPDRYDLHKTASQLLERQERFDAALEHAAEMERLAETAYLQEQALVRRVELYSAAGRLSEEAQKLEAKLKAGEPAVRDLWLAGMLASAERRWSKALGHVETALQEKPDDPLLLRFQAELHEQGGDLAGAVEQYRRLAELEPRNRSDHLRQVVDLELQLGRVEQARQTARELIRLYPERAEGLELAAQIAFRTGDVEAGLDALRRAVRTDPRNIELRQVLASELVEHQRINEAIEHYWRAFELAEDLESKRAVVASLAEQYLVTGRFRELADRLQRMRQRQQDDLTLTLCLVEAYTQAQDFIQARRELNELLAQRPNDVQVLQQLVDLSVELEDIAQATEHQKQVVELAPEAENLQRLADFYSQLGRDEEAREIWMQLARRAQDPQALLIAVNRAAGDKRWQQVVTLAGPEWRERPDDWRFGLRLALAHFKLENYDRAGQICRDILRLVPGKSYQPPKQPSSTQGSVAAWSRQVPPLFMRIQAPRQIGRSLARSQNPLTGSGFSTNPTADLVSAQQFSTILLAEVMGAQDRGGEWIEDLRQRAERDDLRALRQLVWVEMTDPEDNADQMRPLLERWIELNPDDPEPRLALLVSQFSGVAVRRGGPGIEEQLPLLREQYVWFDEHHPAVGRYLASMYVWVLSAVGKQDEAAAVAKKAIREAQTAAELQVAAMTAARIQQDSELFRLLFDKMVQLQQSSGSRSTTLPGGMNLGQFVHGYARSAAEKQKWDELVQLLDRYLTATHPASLRSTSGLSRHARHTATVFGGGTVRSPSDSDPIGAFPVPSPLLDTERFNVLRAVYQALKPAGETQRLFDLTERRIEETEGMPRQCWTMARVCLLWWAGRRPDAVELLDRLVEETPGNTALVILQARAYAHSGDTEKALAALDEVHIPFGPLAKDLETLRMELALRLDRKEPARQAALRLYGMRLSSDEQVRLADVLQRLGLSTRSEQLLQRTVRMSGTGARQLYQLMQQAASQDQDRAVTIARTILRRVDRNPQPNNSNNRYRLEAFKVLQRAGQLEPMIERAERQLAAAPKSVKLLEDLAEYYEAAGKDEKALGMWRRMAEVRPDDARTQYEIARTLFARQKYDEGIERLGVVWEKDPQLVLQQSNDMANYYAQADRLDTLAEHIGKLKGQTQTLSRHGHRLTNLAQRLQRGAADVDDVIKVWRRVLAVVPDNYRDNALQNFSQYLVSQQRQDEAYELYKDAVFPRPGERAASGGAATGSVTYYSNDRLQTSLIRLADLAREVDKQDELRSEAETTAAENEDWKPTGELLVAMLRRRAGEEGPLTELGRRYLDDADLARRLRQYVATLREELSRCEGEAALRAALDLWQNESGRHYINGVSRAKLQIAELHAKLGEREKARQALLTAADGAPQALVPRGNASYQIRQTIQRHSTIGDKLREHGFYLDAVAQYTRALGQDLTQVSANNFIRRHYIPQARRNLRQAVEKLLGERLDETLGALQAELSKQDGPADLGRFFAVIDPVGSGQVNSNVIGTFQQGRAVSGLVFGSESEPNSQRLVLTADDLPEQLLPKLLHRAEQSGRLDDIEQALVERKKKQSEETEQLAALEILIALTRGDTDRARPLLASWSERLEEKPALAAGPETWLVALQALRNEATRETGRELTTAVAKAAGRNGNAGRQQAALLALTLHADGADQAEKVLNEMLSEAQGDPDIRYQVARMYVQRGKPDRAVSLLETVWQRKPELLLGSFEEVVQYYIQAEALDRLAEGLEAVRDGNLQSRYRYEVANHGFRHLPRKSESASQALRLYRAAARFAGPDQRSYVTGRFNSYLRNLPRDEKTLPLYQAVVFPSQNWPGLLPEMARPMLELAESLNRLDDLAARTRKAVEAHPQWQEQGEVLQALIARRQGDEKPLEAVAERYRSNPAYARSLEDCESLLRQEFSECESRPAREVALSLWRQYAARVSGSTHADRQVAQLLSKLGRRDEARQTLLAALERPFPSHYASNPDYLLRETIQRKANIAGALRNLRFHLEALRVYASAGTSDTTGVDVNSSTHRRIADALTNGRRLISQTLESRTESLLEQLRTQLDSTEQPPDLTAFFVVFDEPTGPAQQGRSNAQSEADHPRALLPGLLQRAEASGRLTELREAAQAARQRFPEHRPLLALSALLALHAGETDQARGHLQTVVEMVRKTPESAGGDDVWLLVQQALKNSATAKAAQALAEAVVRNGPPPRREAAALALAESLAAAGETERAGSLLRELLLGEDDTPKARLQLARVLFRTQAADRAVDVLRPVWEKSPPLLLGRFESLAALYVDAGQTAALAEQLKSVRNEDLRDEYANEVINAARNLRDRKERVPESIQLLRAALEFASENRRDYAARSLAETLAQNGRKPEAWTVYKRAVLPPDGPADRLSGLATRLLPLGKELDKLDGLAAECRKALESHADWEPHGQLLLAMIARRQGDTGPLEQLAERFREDDRLASRLNSSASLLRAELAECNAKPALEVAADLWRAEVKRQLARRNSQIAHIDEGAFDRLAEIHLKLKQPEKARQVWLTLLEADMPNYGPSTLAYYRFRRRAHVASELSEAGFAFDALQLHAANLALEGAPVVEQRNLHGQLDAQRTAMHKALHAVLSEGLDSALEALQTELQRETAPPDLGPFFLTASTPWTEEQQKEFPEALQTDGAARLQLLPALLRYARAHGRLESLSQKTAEALERFPEARPLVALQKLIEVTGRPSDEALETYIQLSRESDETVRRLAMTLLGRFQSEQSTAALIEAVQKDPGGGPVAAAALAQQDTPAAAEALGELLRQGDDAALTQRIRAALRRMSTPAARSVIEPKRLAVDEFDGRFGLHWQIRNRDEAHLSFEKRPGTLTITTQKGDFYRDQENFKNLALIENPVPDGTDFSMTTVLAGFRPTADFQQAGLVCFDDADNYLKLTYEWSRTSGDGPWLAVIRETDGKTVPNEYFTLAEQEIERLRLRISRVGGRYVVSTSTDGETFQRHAALDWGNDSPRFLGLVAQNGNTSAPEIDASFESFEIFAQEAPAATSMSAETQSRVDQLTAAIVSQSEPAGAYFQRGDLFARHGQWKKAAGDFDRGLELAPDDHWPWYRGATLQLQIGDLETYRRYCREMLQRFGNPEQLMIAERVSKICLIHPETIEETAPAHKLAERAATEGTESGIYHWFLLAQGIADYRAGDYEKAVEWLEKCRDRTPENAHYCRALADLFAAMAHHRLNQPDSAERFLADAVRRIEDNLPSLEDGQPIASWNDWILCDLIRREAEALLREGDGAK